MILMFLLVLSVVPVEAREARYYRLKGEQLYMQGRFLDALKMFEKYEGCDPEEVVYDEEYLHLKADVNYKLAFFDDAVSGYIVMLETDPENIDYDFLKGLIYRSTDPTKYSYILAVIDSVEQATYASYSFLDTVRRFTVEPCHGLNSSYSEFGAIDYNGRIYFSAINNRLFGKKDINTELAYYSICSSDYDYIHSLRHFGDKDYSMLSKEQRQSVDSLKNQVTLRYEKVLNTNYNNGPIAFYNKESAYVTINKLDRQTGKYYLTLDTVPLTGDSTNNDDLFAKKAVHYFGEYFAPNDVGQITFSKDGKKACMVVKRQHSSSGCDLWFAEKKNDGSWGRPHIANRNINTKQDDVFPFWSEDDYLYYSSTGFVGIGGLDVYRVDMLKRNAKPQNVGLGINSPYDDFAITLDSVGDGYLTSNRAGGQGGDDIYFVSQKYGNIKIVLMSERKTVDNPVFALSESRRNLDIDTVNVLTDPVYVVEHLPYGEYKLDHCYPVDSLYDKVSLYEDTMVVYIEFNILMVDTLPVEFTNFCFDCAGMSGISAEKFQQMVDFLKAFPEIQVVLTGNTDMFGTNEYNDALGMRRAEIMERWLREEGVVNQVIKSSNGKRKLISKTDHRLNRRVDVEFYWPGDTTRIEAIKDDERLERDIVVEYDKAEQHNRPLAPGYYIMIYRSKRFMEVEECAKKYGLGDDIEIVLHSTNSKQFNYYLNVPFDRATEAQEMIESLNLKAKIVYLP